MKTPNALFLSFLFLSVCASAAPEAGMANVKEDVLIDFLNWDSWSLSIPQQRNKVRMPATVSKDVFFQMMRAFPDRRDFARVTLDKRAHIRGEASYMPLVDELEMHLRQFGFKRIVFDLMVSVDSTGDGKFPVVRDTLKQRLQFTSRVTENENCWVALPPNKPGDNTYTYGFIYIDAQAGFTFDMNGFFSVTKDGNIQTQDNSALKQTSIKHRMDRDHLVARLTPEDLKILGEPAEPDWLPHYKVDMGNIANKVRWGWAYNHMGAYNKALTYLEPAYLIAPKNGQLLFELSYSYNALGRAADAERVLVRAVKDLPDDFFVNREYAYLLLHSQRYDKAIVQYNHCIKICPASDMAQKSEAAINLAQAYQQSGDAKNAVIWFENAKKWAPEGSPVADFFKNNAR